MTVAKAKPKAAGAKAKKCEIRHAFGCNGSGTHQYQGTQKGDPKFWACLGCTAMLKRAGVRFKSV